MAAHGFGSFGFGTWVVLAWAVVAWGPGWRRLLDLGDGGSEAWLVVARRLCVWHLGGLGSGGSWLSEFWLWDLGGVGLGCGGLGAWMTEALRFGRW